MSGQLIRLIPWLVVLAVAILIIWGMARENERKRKRTDLEYERDLANNRGSMIAAGALGLEKFLKPAQQAAIEYQQDERGGMTRTGGKSDQPSEDTEDLHRQLSVAAPAEDDSSSPSPDAAPNASGGSHD